MANCYMCGVELDDNKRTEEHIILNAIGGMLKSKNLICKQCNSTFGDEIDSRLAKQLQPFSVLMNVERDKDNNISSIKAYERNNPIKTSYELLWEELKSNTNASLVTTQNIMRRILENYFSILGKTKDDTIVDSFSTIEEKMICRSLLSWINDGSHTIPDDLYIDSYTDSIDRYKQIFKEVFVKMGHEAHYKMMMGEP